MQNEKCFYNICYIYVNIFYILYYMYNILYIFIKLICKQSVCRNSHSLYKKI